jgi:hypothetical protein
MAAFQLHDMSTSSFNTQTADSNRLKWTEVRTKIDKNVSKYHTRFASGFADYGRVRAARARWLMLSAHTMSDRGPVARCAPPLSTGRRRAVVLCAARERLEQVSQGECVYSMSRATLTTPQCMAGVRAVCAVGAQVSVSVCVKPLVLVHSSMDDFQGEQD